MVANFEEFCTQTKTENWSMKFRGGISSEYYKNFWKLKIKKQNKKKYSVKLPNVSSPNQWKPINCHIQSDKTKKTETWNGVVTQIKTKTSVGDKILY